MKKSNFSKVIFGVLFVAGGYFIYKYFRDNRKKVGLAPAPQGENSIPSAPRTIETKGFPLKKGSKGVLVTNLQTLILKINDKLLPKFGADGDFGSETEAALFTLIGKNSVDTKSDMNKLNELVNRKLFPYVTPRPLASDAALFRPLVS